MRTKCKFILKPRGAVENTGGTGYTGTERSVFSLLLQKLQRFMYGRYGGDKFSIVLLAAGLVLSLCGSLFFWPLTILADVLYIYTLFRMFSRNIPARQREYAVFCKAWSPVEGWFRLQKRKVSERGTMKYFKCPNCRQTLRAPKGRGKIEVTCQKCHKVFQTKT